MEYVNLNNGIKMPKLGLGTFKLQPKDAEESVYNKKGNKNPSAVLILCIDKDDIIIKYVLYRKFFFGNFRL